MGGREKKIMGQRQQLTLPVVRSHVAAAPHESPVEGSSRTRAVSRTRNPLLPAFAVGETQRDSNEKKRERYSERYDVE